jgi:UDP-N-acetylmuramoylalanine--D-glutamate ligase
LELEGKRLLVVGLERTGLATALFCRARGARVTASELRPEEAVASAAAQLRAAGIALELGGHCRETFLEQDLIVPSPGVPLDSEPLAAARASGIPVWSEIELASRFLRGPLVAVTGSNGKTTTTLLIGHVLREAGRAVLVGGNVGTPLISLVDQSTAKTITVAEVSSFQLEAIDRFRPDIALLLNVTPDHLDRHHSLEAYARAKARLFENQLHTDAAVLNADDPGARRLAPQRPRQFWFSRLEPVDAGACLAEGTIVFRSSNRSVALLDRNDIPLRGEHNVENVLAAACAADLLGLAPEAIRAGVRSFPGVEHRLEFVADIAGIAFYNDSKATNVDASLKAIDAFPGNLLVILGGKDKGGDFTPLAKPLSARARLTLVIGAAAEKIATQLAGSVPLERAGTLERAVERAFGHARPGDTVLLAPACASFDQFENYEHRGRVFKDIVRRIENRMATEGR